MTVPIHLRDTAWAIRLHELSLTIKILFTATLMTMGMAYVFAVTNVGLAIGLTPIALIEHYWGDPATRAAMESGDEQATESSEEEFSFEDLEADAAVSQPVRSIPSFPSLVAEGHFHLFGYAMIFFICGFIISFAEMPAFWKRVLVLAPFVGSVFDIWSIFLTRFVGPSFSWMLIMSGSLMGISFLVIFVIAMKQMWLGVGRHSQEAI